MTILRSAIFAFLLGIFAAQASATEVGDQAPSLGSTKSFNTPDGAKIDLDKLHGKVVLIDFWATWCGPCVVAIPHVQELHEKYAEQGLVVIGHTDGSSKDLENFIKQKDITYTISLGEDIGGSWGVTGIPSVFVLDVEGKVIWKGHPAELKESDLKAALEKVSR